MGEFFLILPEILLLLTLVFVVIGEITYTGEQVRLVTITALLGLGSALVQVLISYRYGTALIFGGAISVDPYSLFFKLVFISLSIFTIFATFQTREVNPSKLSAYISLVIASTLAMCLVASATDIILGVVALSFLNTVSYILAAFGKRSLLSTEAAVKYLAFGAVAATLLIYSLAILFTFTHTLNIYEMHRILLQSPLSPQTMLVVFMLSFLALSFYLGVFPMYFLIPDVLEGAPTPISAFLAMGARTAGFAFAVRYLISVFAQPGLVEGQWQVLNTPDWTQIISVVAGLTMLIGSLLAFRQKAAKRLVNYLVIVESGFALIGLVVLDKVGIAAMLYNFVIELLAFVGIYYILAIFADKFQADKLESLKGLLGKAVPECVCLIMFLFCIAGSPPFPGFIGKFALIGTAVQHHRLILAATSVLSMVLSTVAVARLTYYLVGDFKISKVAPLVFDGNHKYFLTALVIPLFLAGIFADWIIRWAGYSVSFIFW